jgi:UDP-3-O-[3-hydroxymyristoyl] glucosamine N-acyltransferase
MNRDKITVEYIAKKISAKVAGNISEEITGPAPFENAEKGSITFAARPEFIKKIENCRASAIIVPEGVKAKDKTLLYVDNPLSAFVEVIKVFYPEKSYREGISPWAVVASTASIGKGTTIFPLAYVGNNTVIGEKTLIFPGVVILDDCKIGDNTVLFPNVVVYNGCKIGNNVRVHSGSVIGADGFGYFRGESGHVKIPQVGIVEIGDDVEIGANCTIDRATLGVTKIKKGTKIDNLVHIGHNVQIGERDILVAQVGISGSTEIGNDSILAGQVGVVDHVKIGDNVIVGAQSGVAHDIPGPGMFMGAPAVPHSVWLKYVSIFPRLPEVRKKLMELEKEVKSLKKIVEEIKR